MPFDGNKWNFKKMVPYQELLATIRNKYPSLYRISDQPNDTSKVLIIFYDHHCLKTELVRSYYPDLSAQAFDIICVFFYHSGYYFPLLTNCKFVFFLDLQELKAFADDM